MWGDPRALGLDRDSLDEKPADLDAILRDAGGPQGLAVQLIGDPNAF
jgi:hypothetical protein